MESLKYSDKNFDITILEVHSDTSSNIVDISLERWPTGCQVIFI